MGDDNDGERRRAKRVPINAEFATLPAATYVSDLSEHGVFVHTDHEVDIGMVLDLRFTVILDDPVIVRARGRVVRQSDNPCGVGIEFTELEPEMLLRVNRVVTRQRQRAGTQTESETPAAIALGRPIEATGVKLKLHPADSGGKYPVLTDIDLTQDIEGRISDIEDEVEAATTLVNLKKVEAQIANDDSKDDAEVEE